MFSKLATRLAPIAVGTGIGYTCFTDLPDVAPLASKFNSFDGLRVSAAALAMPVTAACDAKDPHKFGAAEAGESMMAEVLF